MRLGNPQRWISLAVSSIDDQVVPLNKLGIDTGQRSSDDKVKTLMITDPDGNHIAFAEVWPGDRYRVSAA